MIFKVFSFKVRDTCPGSTSEIVTALRSLKKGHPSVFFLWTDAGMGSASSVVRHTSGFPIPMEISGRR
jgi:hypothetical protein